jgi:type I restriction enzyme S subunit
MRSGWTVIAMLPRGWRRSSIGEAAKFLSGNTPSKDNASYWSGDFPWVTARDMKNLWLQNAALGLSVAGRSVCTSAPPQSILVLTRGMTLLKDLPICLIDREMAFNQDIKALVPNASVDATFLAYQLVANKNEILNLVDTAGHGTGRLDTDLLKYSSIVVPPLSEQRRIAHILKTWDMAINTSQRIIVNSRKQKQALMHQLLDAQRRGRGGSRGWKTYWMRDLFSERVEPGRADLPLLSITRDQGVISREDVGRKDTSNEDKSKYLRICPGDIGYNTMRMWQGVSALSQLEGIVSPAYTIVTPSHLIDGQFAAYLFKLDRVVFEFYRYSQGLVSDTWNLKYPHFAKIKITIPARAQQEEIVRVLSAADAMSKIEVQKIEKLELEKRALLKQLLTGKRRTHPLQPSGFVVS